MTTHPVSRCLGIVACAVFFPTLTRAEIRLPSVFSDHMVVQRERPIPIWGWATAGKSLAVRLGDGPEVEAKAGADGAWRVELPAREAGGPFRLSIRGDGEKVVEDVLVGEVWLCSGQSNMEWTVAASANPKEEAARANHPMIRHLKVPKTTMAAPQADQPGTWQVCSPETVSGFTAAGYYFARELQKELGVPVGLLNASWGGTRIEPWTAPTGFAKVKELADLARSVAVATPGTPEHRGALEAYLAEQETWSRSTRQAMAGGNAIKPPPPFPDGLRGFLDNNAPQQQPTTLFHGMIAPLVGYGIRGALWYQGESNHGEGAIYSAKKRALVESWRDLWNQGEFPFYFVQIAPFQYGEEDPNVLPVFWEAQAACLAIPNTGMAVIHDVGDLKDIHPKNKQEVGRRLALLALSRDYGKKDLVASGPVFAALDVAGREARVKWSEVGTGLETRDGKAPDSFELFSAASGFVAATARIEGKDTVVLSAEGVENPTGVRFAWHKLTNPNLRNREGLPARQFRAGDFTLPDSLDANVPEAKAYLLAYDLDLAKLGAKPGYSVTPAPGSPKARKVAYYLELQAPGKPAQWIWVSMDAPDPNPDKLGVPTAASGAAFQSEVKNVETRANVPGVPSGQLPGARLEFWPDNYGKENSARVPGARDDLYDHGDNRTNPRDGYGSMQIHAPDGTTLFSLNNWKAGAEADLGIGRSPEGNPDWTFRKNAGSYTAKRLRVFVLP